MGAPGLICLDMDGTLYQDRAVYPQLIDCFFRGTPFAPLTGAVKALMEEILAGRHPFRCGRFAPKGAVAAAGRAEDLLPPDSRAALLEPDPTPWLDRSAWSYVGDGWTLGMYLARRIGWGGDDFWRVFAGVRAQLFCRGPDPALAEVLSGLRRRGTRLVLCSNARAETGLPLLARLGLADCFDQVVFDADKPHSFPRRMAAWQAEWGVSPAELLFVGDLGYPDLYAGKRAGAATLLVSPHHPEDASLWDLRLETLAQLKAHLAAL